ncbi:uncharacterized protein LOC143561114 [Bidens hawaiensis]|uniref:uncharacterized protein LOC143561114 n=1 Tax=Bidens hawaiensis TaxID=980011 RepID=UPI00404AEA78
MGSSKGWGLNDLGGLGGYRSLPHRLLAFRTLKKTSHEETPFSLTYGTEAMIPSEIGLPSARVLLVEEGNEIELRLNLDQLEERRELAAIKEEQYKRQIKKYYNSRVKERTFRMGEYVFRNREASNAESPKKISLKWEVPYKIYQVLGKGAYSLEKLDRTLIPLTWNATQLQ